MAWLVMPQTLPGYLAIVLILLVTYNFISQSPWKRLPPGPRCYPVIGSLPSLLGDIRESMSRLATKYGDIFMIYVGPERAVVLNGYDVIKDAMLTHSGQFDDRSPKFNDMLDHGGFSTSNGARWKQHRRLLLRAMKDFGLFGRRMETSILEESEQLISILQQTSGKPYNMEPLLKKSVSNVISRLFGKHWDYHDPEYAEHIRLSDELMELCAPDNPVWTFPLLRYIPGDPCGFHKSAQMWTKLCDIYRSWVDDGKTKLSEDEEPTDIIGLYLKELTMEKGHRNNTFSENGLIGMMGDVFLAGTDTTSNTLVWALLQLILNPIVQEKVQAEIDDVVGIERLPDMQDRYSMPYTEAVISEVQRWADLVPFAVPHYSSHERTFRGYTIPKDTMILLNLHSVHYDPKLWPKPNEFDPLRFLKDGKYQPRDELIPFSIGKRSCPGEGLARMEIFLILTRLLQTFTFTTDPDESSRYTENLTNGILGLTYHAKPFNLIVNRRS